MVSRAFLAQILTNNNALFIVLMIHPLTLSLVTGLAFLLRVPSLPFLLPATSHHAAHFLPRSELLSVLLVHRSRVPISVYGGGLPNLRIPWTATSYHAAGALSTAPTWCVPLFSPRPRGRSLITKNIKLSPSREGVHTIRRKFVPFAATSYHVNGARPFVL